MEIKFLVLKILKKFFEVWANLLTTLGIGMQQAVIEIQNTHIKLLSEKLDLLKKKRNELE